MEYMNGMVKNMKVTGKKVNNMVKDISQMYKVKKRKVYGIQESVYNGQMKIEIIICFYLILKNFIFENSFC